MYASGNSSECRYGIFSFWCMYCQGTQMIEHRNTRAYIYIYMMDRSGLMNSTTAGVLDLITYIQLEYSE